MGEVVFVDANIFLEVILKDEKNEACKSFLNEVISGQIKAVTSDFLIYASLLQIQYKSKNSELMKEFLVFIDNLNFLEIIRPSLVTMDNAVSLSKQHNLDFDDALIVACMRSKNINVLVSLDKHFDKVEGMVRVEPK